MMSKYVVTRSLAVFLLVHFIHLSHSVRNFNYGNITQAKINHVYNGTVADGNEDIFHFELGDAVSQEGVSLFYFFFSYQSCNHCNADYRIPLNNSIFISNTSLIMSKADHLFWIRHTD